MRSWYLRVQLNHFFTIPSQKATLLHKRSRSEEDNNLWHNTRGRILLQTCNRNSVSAYNQYVKKILEKLNSPIDSTTLHEDWIRLSRVRESLARGKSNTCGTGTAPLFPWFLQSRRNRGTELGEVIVCATHRQRVNFPAKNYKLVHGTETFFGTTQSLNVAVQKCSTEVQ